ncbi:endoplasmic reticulum metallopeptidase 1 isoform X1 [Tripterygium wilfordii]|uniref:Endoplasmic reticulum metallopeptidase 1 isoform X1 n=1 Tax=Tripterygium wilfordii TaxID=458696 RepID=A0A7J7DK45_TRIWF|nr:endoplasmic reticulum metallopeptidase 1 [Tripterygium wilfordii]KAF5746446.1 endoplasmic reticulum metallopeptidase 1 isoform X1 [Tripterygium wilfordii]
MAFRLDARDVAGFKFLFSIAIMYGLMSALVYSVLHMKFVNPLGFDAPLDRFSEARAVEHVRVLAEEIDGRQEGRPGLTEAAMYIKSQLEAMKGRAGSDFRIEIEENIVAGSFNMMFLGHSLSLTYRNHTNIVMRISSADSQDTDPSVLINAHFDSPVGSPGAGDCGSCVASLLELARVTIDSGWVPPRPIIFLFNGAEELYMLGSHGFMTSHKWRDSIGASINVEASGTGGPDLVCQSGPTPWPSLVYAQSAVYPMADSAAQDVFPVIPGDTDYRIFSKDYGNIPSLDIIFLLGGYFYHTSYDTVDRLLPGSMQARGENLFNILKGFTNSSELRNGNERTSIEVTTNEYKDEKAVFFDYLTWFMVFYSRRAAMVLHSIPVVIFLLMPFLLLMLSSGLRSPFVTFYDFLKGMLFHASGIVLAIVIPIIFSILRLLFSSYAMSWFAHPYLAFMLFVPCSLMGLLIPRIFWSSFPLSQDASILKTSKEALSDEARFWGAFGFYALETLAYLVTGLSGGFFTFTLSAFMLPAWIFFGLATKFYGRQSLRSTVFYVITLIPFLTYSAYFGGFLAEFLIEKMGMMGALPPPFGYFIADILVAAVIGVATGWCVGPLIPICGYWLARSSIMQFLLHVSVLAMALSSQFFPYGTAAPKRLVFQHTFVTTDANRVVDSSYEFAVVDSNSLSFVFKYAPEAAKEIHINSEFSFETANMSQRANWMAIYPLSFLFSRSLKFPARSDDMLKRYRYLPHLSNYKPHTISGDGGRRVHLELSLGDLEEVWVTVVNITGPLSSWSFADNILPVTETLDGGPPSYICRLSGSSHDNWTFWLEASSSEDLRVEVAVLDQVLVDEVKKLKGLFPNWVDVIAYSSFMSSYIF